MPAKTPMDGTEWFVTAHTTITDPEIILPILLGMLRQAGFTIRGEPRREVYDNGAETILIALGESHAICSNYPDDDDPSGGVSAITVGSCVEELRDNFVGIIRAHEGMGFCITALGVAQRPSRERICRYGMLNPAKLLHWFSAPKKEAA